MFLTKESKISELPIFSHKENILDDHKSMGFSLNGHILDGATPFELADTSCSANSILNNITSSNALLSLANKSYVTVVGLVIVRQKPPTAKGNMFLTIEDSFGLMNIVVKNKILERYKHELRDASILKISGVLQNIRQPNNLSVVSIVADTVADITFSMYSQRDIEEISRNRRAMGMVEAEVSFVSKNFA